MGKSAHATSRSTAGPGLPAATASDPSTMSALMRTRSSGAGEVAVAAQAATTTAAPTARGIRAPSAPARSAYSMNASTAAMEARTSVATGGRNHTVPTTIGMRMTALRTRVMRPATSARGDSAASATGDRRLLDPAVTAVALLVREDRLEQMTLPEVAPQRLGDPDLCVGDLPEQEIAHSHFAARPNEQIGIWLTGGIEEARKARFVELFSANALGQRPFCGLDDL